MKSVKWSPVSCIFHVKVLCEILSLRNRWNPPKIQLFFLFSNIIVSLPGCKWLHNGIFFFFFFPGALKPNFLTIVWKYPLGVWKFRTFFLGVGGMYLKLLCPAVFGKFYHLKTIYIGTTSALTASCFILYERVGFVFVNLISSETSCWIKMVNTVGGLCVGVD